MISHKLVKRLPVTSFSFFLYVHLSSFESILISETLLHRLLNFLKLNNVVIFKLIHVCRYRPFFFSTLGKVLIVRYEDCLLLLWSQRMACVPIASVTGMWCRSGVAGIIKGQLSARRARPSLMRHATGRESCGMLGYVVSYKQH